MKVLNLCPQTFWVSGSVGLRALVFSTGFMGNTDTKAEPPNVLGLLAAIDPSFSDLKKKVPGCLWRGWLGV